MPNDAVTIYVTHDAPTKGIRTLQTVNVAPDDRTAILCCKMEGVHHVLLPGEFTFDWNTARRRAEQQRADEIERLEREIAAIRAIDLTKPVEG